MRALVVLLFLYGCGGSSSPPEPDLSDVDPAPTVDFAIAPDLAPRSTAGIVCGDTTCAANAQFCCTSTSGTTGMCGEGDDAANCAGSRFYCDGPEDCPPALPQCCITDAVANCTDTACATQAEGGGQLCHADADCGGQKCCSSDETPYELCLASCS